MNQQPVPPDCLSDVARKCFETAVRKGWWDKYYSRDETPRRAMTPDEVAAKLCLIHSEVSEALEEVRNDRPSLYFSRGASTPGMSFSEECQQDDAGAKPEGLAAELADVVIRVFDLAGFLDIDIADVIKLKMAYNESRPHRHGGKKL